MTNNKPHSNLDELLLSRACRYGNFNDVASRTARIYHNMVYGAPQFISKKDMSAHYEALHMIAVKVARLVEGQINDADSWRDIAGYALLVHNHITIQEEAKAAKSPASPFSNTAVIDAMEAELAADISGK